MAQAMINEISKDYYAILGVRPAATQDEIIEAFFQHANEYYPLLPSNAGARVQMTEVGEAWNVLSDHKQRAAYDLRRRRRRQGLLTRMSKAPRAAGSNLVSGVRWFTHPVVSNASKLVLLAISALILAGAFGIGSAEQSSARAANGNLNTGNVPLGPTLSELLAGLLPLGPTPTLSPETPATSPTEGSTGEDSGNVAETLPADSVPADNVPADPVPAHIIPPYVVPTDVIPATKIPSDAAAADTNLAATHTPTLPAATTAPAAITRIFKTSTPFLPKWTATATATAAGYKYPAPTLLMPSNGSHFRCNRELLLSWSVAPGTNLAADEWFIVEVRPLGAPQWYGIAEWTRAQNAVVGPVWEGKSCEIPTIPSGPFEWHVLIAQGDKSTHTFGPALSQPSASFLVNYGD